MLKLIDFFSIDTNRDNIGEISRYPFRFNTYRFKSNYSDSAGGWRRSKEEAIQDGINHAKIFCTINKLEYTE